MMRKCRTDETFTVTVDIEAVALFIFSYCPLCMTRMRSILRLVLANLGKKKKIKTQRIKQIIKNSMN